ncbi:mannose-binding protein C-like isoform X4 [Erpetoichthys calabaricus]|uniref:mannose-binding protein C-like isoform X4 n=1 Tax=Erpetoichthys calabaricus TaxID=27687 RepID=UPI002234CA66|nr:mannose-binding protein C-like isoform X4 [Erpetoichthys calabaricus]
MQLQSLVLTSAILSMAIWSCLTEEPTNGNVFVGIPGLPGRDGREGRDGKEGREGRDGPPGTKGGKGEKGQSADMRRIAQLETEIQALKTTISNLEKRMQFIYWSKHGQKRFGTKNDQLTFDDGVKLCKEASGEIAMPANAGENAALMKLVKSSEAYLGLNDRVKEGRFEDVSGNPVTFTNWKSGEPNNYNGNEDCSIITSDGIWNDVPCSRSYTIICQFQ